MLFALTIWLSAVQDRILTTSPQLQLETGNHAIGGEGHADDSGRWYVTGGTDDVVRIWSLGDLHLFRSIYVPADETLRGEVFRVAISGDGRRVAAGTQGDAPWFRGSAAMIFDRTTGAMEACVAGLEGSVSGLALSKMGDRIAIGTAVRTDRGLLPALCVYRTQPKPQLLWNARFRAPVYGVRFASDGRVVASSDTEIRLFRADGSQVASANLRAREPRFSPDGSLIAIDGATVLSARDLTVQWSADTAGRDRGEFAIPCWSRDGKTLAAACMARTQSGEFVAALWPDRGRGKIREVVLPTKSWIPGVAATADGFVFRSGDTAIFKVDPKGNMLQRVEVSRPVIARPVQDADAGVPPNLMRTSGDLQRLMIPLQWPDNRFLYIDLRRKDIGVRRRFEVDDRDLSAPRQSSLGISFGFDRFHPTLNSKALDQPAGQYIHTWSCAPDGRRIATVGLWQLRCYNQEGRVEWAVRAPRDSCQVAFSQDGRLIVVGCGDGTVRWYASATGEQLLALFCDSRTNEWIVWTPVGYYGCSPAAEKLLLWKVNQGVRHAARTYPIAVFRRRLFRPDVVDRILAHGQIETALAEANLFRFNRPTDPQARGTLADNLPPAIEEAYARLNEGKSPLSATVHAIISYRPEQPLSGIEIRVNTLRVDTVSDLLETHDGIVAINRQVPVGSAKDSIQVIAKYPGGQVQEAAPIVTARASRDVTASVPQRRDRQLFVIALAVDQLGPKSGIPNLSFAEADATSFVTMLRQNAPAEYQEVHEYPLVGPKATARDLEDAVQDVQTRTHGRTGDTVVFFLAGHGVLPRTLEESGNGPLEYFFPLRDYDPKRVVRTTLRVSRLAEYANDLSNCYRLVFLDTCHSNSATTPLVSLTSAEVVPIADKVWGLGVWAASGANELARESAGLEHGYFTKSLLDGIEGGAARGETRVSFSALRNYVESLFMGNGPFRSLGQHPFISPGDIPIDFPIAERKAFSRLFQMTKHGGS